MIDRKYRLSYEDRIKGRSRLQKEAIDQIMNVWKAGERSAVLIRPTGFGKTFTVATLLNLRNPDGSFMFNKAVFVYPMNCIVGALKSDIMKVNTINKIAGRTLIPNNAITFLSYSKLAKYSSIAQEEYNKKYNEYDLLIFDEFHCAGASKTSVGCAKLFKAAANAKALGMTATFNRTDGVNQAIEVFDAHNLTNIYTYTDAVKDGLMPKLAYYDGYMYRMFDANGKAIKANDTQAITDTYKLIEKVESETVIDNTIHNFGEMIKDAVIDALGQQELAHGMRWLCYFADIKAINAKIQEIEVSFKTAFPNKEIKLLKISSEDSTTKTNLDLLEQKYDNQGKEIHNEWLEPADNECVVLLTCNMLNMGYHAGHLTGEILYRKTGSETVYQQQIGRAITIERETEPIIIDIVRALDFVTNKKWYNYANTPTKSGKRDEANSMSIMDANYIAGECLEIRTVSKAYQEVANKLEKMRYHDILAELLAVILKMPSITTKSIADYARHYRLHPKYIFGELKHAVQQGECDVMLTKIGTLNGIIKIDKQSVHKVLTNEEKEKINNVFKHLTNKSER